VQTHFPSGDGSDLGVGLLLAPFRGVRYDLSRVGGLANVSSPPYDVIGPGTLERLLASSPYNVVRLILPADVAPEASTGSTAREPEDRGPERQGASARNTAAAALLHEWLAEGVLAVDGAPAFYVYEQRADAWAQRGLIGLVAVATDAVHPHEAVMPGPVAGRRELMQATRSNLEPILLVYNGGYLLPGGRPPVPQPDARPMAKPAIVSGAPPAPPPEGRPPVPQPDARPMAKPAIVSGAPPAPPPGGRPPVPPGVGAGGPDRKDRDPIRPASTNEERLLGGHGPATPGAASRLTDLTADSQAPLACAVTDDGVTHRLWAVTDPAAQAAISADLATRTALIADGHHRYAAYRELQTEMRDSGLGAGPWDYGLAFLVDADAYPLRLGPIHRVLPHLDPAEAARLAADSFTVTAVPGEAAMDRLAVAGESGTAFLIAGNGRYWLLTDPDQQRLAAAMPPETSPRLRALDASVMQELLLAQLWSIKDNERDVLISHDADEAVAMAADSGGTAVICNPMPLAAVMDIAAHGEKVPRKSTSFGPKPRTGLVLRTFE
jgi:uncharacterized protein (DUF1015 family)